MALLLKRGALDPEMVWHTFFYWIDNYYAVAESYIRARQARDPLVWKDLDDLVRRVRRMQRQRLGVSALPSRTAEETAQFLNEESGEASL